MRGNRCWFSVGLPVLRRRALSDRDLLVSEGFFSGSATSSHQSFFVPLLVHLGIGGTALGIFSAFNGLLANVSGLAGSRVARGLPNRRALAALASGLGRGLFFVIALLLLFGGNDTSTVLLMALALLSATFIGLGLPSVTTMVADAVDTRHRGSFFANRLLASGIGAAFVTLGVAAVLRLLEPPSGFTVAYLVAGVAGLGSVFCLLRLRAEHGPTPTTTVLEPTRRRHAPVSPLMRRYAAATFILWFGAAMVAPVLTPFILNDLGASPSFIGLQGALSAVIAIGCQRWWGRRVDRYGSFGVLLVCTVAVSMLPPLYAVAPTYWFGLGYEVLASIGWSGYALGSVNFAVQLAPDDERSQYVAVNNAAAGIGAFLGPLTGALLVGVVSVEAVLFLAGGVRLLSLVALSRARPEDTRLGVPDLRLPRWRLRIARRRTGAFPPTPEPETAEEGMNDA